MAKSPFDVSYGMYGSYPPVGYNPFNTSTMEPIEVTKMEEVTMISQEIVKRIGKAAGKDGILACVHADKTYVEATDGKVLIRETVSKEPGTEQYFDTRSLKDIKHTGFPASKVGEMLSNVRKTPTIFSIGIGRDVLYKLCQAIPEGAMIQLEIKGTENPVYFKALQAEGLLMPMKIEQKAKVEVKEDKEEEPAPAVAKACEAPKAPSIVKEAFKTPPPTPPTSIVKIVIENGKVVRVEGLPEGFEIETEYVTTQSAPKVVSSGIAL